MMSIWREFDQFIADPLVCRRFSRRAIFGPIGWLSCWEFVLYELWEVWS